MKKTRLIYRYIIHLLRATNTKGHGIHSPYLFSFVQHVIYNKHPFYDFQTIEKQRKKLEENKQTFFQKDYGTGQSQPKTIKQIASTSLKRPYWSQLLFRIIHFTQSQHILELGTSLGITTCYLATANKGCICHTLEGCPQIASIAQQTFNSLSLQNISLSVGDIKETLPNILAQHTTIDFVFIDANHQQQAVLKNFELCEKKTHKDSIIIIDDIHWSKGMEKAWNEICMHKNVTATMDLFELGIVFFNPNFTKKTFYLNTFNL